MKAALWLSVSAVALSGCMASAPAQPVRPVLSCDDCKGLTYYGPQLPPAPDPRVQIVETVANAVTGVTGIIVKGNVATTVSSDLARGVLAPSLQAPGPSQTSLSTYIERDSTYIERDSTYIERDSSSTSVSDFRDSSSTVNTTR